MPQQTLRLDDHDVDKATRILKNYEAKHKGTLYLLNKEVGSETGKLHMQGWVEHNQTLKSFSQYITRSYPEHKGSAKSCVEVNNFDNHVAYIINNTGKDPVKYGDVITNYSEDDFNKLQSNKQFIPVEKRTRKIKQSYYEDTLDALERGCVVDGKIQYNRLMGTYMSHVPKKLNARILYDNLLGLTVRLEYRYPDNDKARNSLYNQVCRLDDEHQIFSSDPNNTYLKYDDI